MTILYELGTVGEHVKPFKDHIEELFYVSMALLQHKLPPRGTFLMKSLPLGLLYCHCHDRPVPRQTTNWPSLQLRRNGIHHPMQWMVGSYSGRWKSWKGKRGQYTDVLPLSSVVLREINFSPAKQLPAAVVAALKSIIY